MRYQALYMETREVCLIPSVFSSMTGKRYRCTFLQGFVVIYNRSDEVYFAIMPFL